METNCGLWTKNPDEAIQKKELIHLESMRIRDCHACRTFGVLTY